MTNRPSEGFRLSFFMLVAVSVVATMHAVAATDCTNLPDGTACDDGNACTTGETCLSGSCIPPVSFVQPAGSPVAVGMQPYSVAAGDVNGDGRIDLAVANFNSTDVTILLGNGAGGFSPASGSPVGVGMAPVNVALGDLNGDGKLDLVAVNYYSNDITILLGNGAGGFSQASGSPIPVGTLPSYVAVGDLNGDGKLDLAVANSTSGNITILLGNGSGGFSQAAGSPVAAGAQPASVTVGDLNGDGKRDLAVANRGSGNVTILLGNGAGGFSQAAGSPVAAGTSPQNVAASDLNGDGKLDLAVANAGSADITILLGNGSGAFTQAAGSPVAVGTQPTSIAVGDLNGDGKPDLAVANYLSSSVTILLGNGSGGFSQAPASPVAVGTQPTSVAAADLNGDGRLDLAVANATSSDITILLNTTNSATDGSACDDGNACTVGETCRSGSCLAPLTLTQPAGSPVASGMQPASVAIGDMNGDGKMDLAVANFGTNDVTILLGNGSGSFSPPAGSPVAVATNPLSVAIGDLNGDGKLDLAVANYGSDNVTILLGNGAGGFSQAAGSPVAVGTLPASIVVGDFNGDGKPDLAVANYFSSSVTILLGNGSGGFSPAAGSPAAVGTSPYSVAVGDANGDGKLDLAVANYGSNDVTILLGNGSGGFVQAAGSPVATGTLPYSVNAADLNGDGRLDLAVANVGSNNVTILLGNGSGGFSQAAGSPVGVGTQPASVTIGDVNGDGQLDISVANYGSNTVSFLLGNGSGRFIQATGSPVAVGTGAQSAAAADLNADGTLDLVVANYGSNNVTILLGAPCPSCRAPSLTPSTGSPVGTGAGPFSVATGDMNGDGRLDLAVANYGSNNVTILLGDGTGGFGQAAGSPVAVGSVPVSVAIGDWNRDGKLDLAVANYTSLDVTILLGNGFGGFTPAAGSPVATGNGPRSIAVGDMNGDGKLDLAVANYFSSSVTILLGNGSGGFSPAAGSPVAVGTNPASVAIGDLNRDGRRDLAVANFNSNDVSILLGNGSGAFSPASGSPIAVGTAPDSIAIGDLSGDGKLDIGVANFFSNTVTILLGNGSGAFSEAAGSPVAVGTQPVAVAIGDVNGDGRLDLASANNFSNDVTILLGNGAGGFSQMTGSPVPVGANPRAVAFGTLNGDATLDLVVVNYSANNVTILLRTTIFAPNGTTCDDGNACTLGETCGGGICANGTTITAPLEIQNVIVAGNKATYSWSAATYATQYDVVRGSTGALPVGPGGGDEVCFDNLSGTTLVDAAVPTPGTGFWYLSRGENACGIGTFGTRSNGSPRITTTCP